MFKALFAAVFAVLMLFPLTCRAAAFFSQGEIDNELKYEKFMVKEDGSVEGTIVNASGKVRQNVQFDVWATDVHETRILWRKAVDIGTMAPGAKYTIKDPARINVSDPSRVKFIFKLKDGTIVR
ncbi:MAG: hypothetical protein ABFD98_01390 [Syntrophobacteraceae bacterium]|nr:hypothetical protein [Desulfobacteraceae bacterium]